MRHDDRMDDQVSGPAGAVPGEPADVASVVAERDALRAEVDALRTRGGSGGRSDGRLRRVGAVALVLVFALSFLASGVGIWLQRSTLDEDVWRERVVPIGQDEEVQQALAAWTTDQLMATVDTRALVEEALPERGVVLAGPMSAAVEGFVADRVDAFFASERFEELWAAAAVRAHQGAVAVLRDERPNVVAGEEGVVINLIPIIDAVLTDVLDAAPELVGRDVQLPEVSVEDLPDEARARLAEALGVELDDGFGTITVYDGGKLAGAQDVVAAFDRFVVLTSLLAVAAAGGALWLSPRRRRTLLQLVGAAALVCVVVRRVAFTLQDEVVGLVRVDENRGAASVVVAAFVDPLTRAAGVALLVLVVVAVVAAVTGPYPWAVRWRERLAASGGTERVEGAEAWAVAHADLLRIGGYLVGAVVLWFADLTWWTFVLLVALVVGWQVLVHRLAPSPPPEVPAPG